MARLLFAIRVLVIHHGMIVDLDSLLAGTSPVAQ
jgi:hypothetical protein